MKHPHFTEEERVVEKMKELKTEGKISNTLFEEMVVKGLHTQPGRLYGLAKVHKQVIPTRPVLSMPGSVYHPIAEKVTGWLNVVEECQIETSTKKIMDSLKTVKLEEDEVIVSFDVTSLYTNFPRREAIDVCTDLLYSGKYILPPVDKQMLKICWNFALAT